jgi:hypothetical protein
LDPDFKGVEIDKVLYAREKEGREDFRNCLVFWGRPTFSIQRLVAEIQSRLSAVISGEFYFSFSSFCD